MNVAAEISKLTGLEFKTAPNKACDASSISSISAVPISDVNIHSSKRWRRTMRSLRRTAH